MVLPLDKKFITRKNAVGKEEQMPALHPDWRETSRFVTYKSLPPGQYSGAAFEEWCERLGFLVEDLTWLLRLPHHKYWCQVIFDETLHISLDSFLKFAPRQYDHSLPDRALNQLQSANKLVFLVYVRMATHKESKDSIITPAVFGDIIYENFLFDIPKLMDLCVLYGNGNQALLSKMIQNIFTQQPKYEDDLHHSVQSVFTIFENIEQKCNVDSNPGTYSPQKLSEAGRDITAMSEQEFADILFYLADSAATLLSFLEIYPAACTIYHTNGFCNRVAVLFEGVVTLLREALKERNFSSESLKKSLRQQLSRAEHSLVRLFRLIVNTCCIQPMLEQSGNAEDCIEDFLSLMSGVLGERRFLAKYQSLFRFEDDQSMLSQLQYSVDEARLRFIHDGIKEAYSTFKKVSPLKQTKPLHAQPSSSGTNVASASKAAVASSNPEDAYTDLEGACAARTSGVELDSLITSVKDLLPDLGDGFIELCLEEMDFSVERVINMVLEDNFPPSLTGVDRSLQRIQPAPEAPPTALSQRANIYDHDEFDVFSKTNVDTTRINKGKKEKTTKSTLDDKTSVHDLKPLYDTYSLVDSLSYYDDAMYDDEYDDTYDTHEIGADDADSADELTQRRPFVVPRALGGGAQSEEEEEEENTRENEPQTTDRRRENQHGNKSQDTRPQNGTRNPGKGNQAKKYDVKGKPKGQGQETNVVKNRDFKEKHKGSRANHNRKNMADRKRNKGMIPS